MKHDFELLRLCVAWSESLHYDPALTQSASSTILLYAYCMSSLIITPIEDDKSRDFCGHAGACTVLWITSQIAWGIWRWRPADTENPWWPTVAQEINTVLIQTASSRKIPVVVDEFQNWAWKITCSMPQDFLFLRCCGVIFLEGLWYILDKVNNAFVRKLWLTLEHLFSAFQALLKWRTEFALRHVPGYEWCFPVLVPNPHSAF